MKLLMITGDRVLAQGRKGPFYYMLEEFSKYWDRVDIICPKIPKPKAQIPNQAQNPNVKKFHNNVYVHPSPWSIWWQPWFILKKGVEIYKKEKFDLFTVHSYPPFYNDIGGCWLFKKIKVPYVLEIHHINAYPRAEDFKQWIYKILIKLFIKYFAQKARAIRVVNQKQVPEFLKKLGIKEEKIKYISSAYIDLGIFKPEETAKKYDIVFSGRLVKNKGIFLLLEAIKKIKKAKPPQAYQKSKIKMISQNLKLVIIGSGPLENKIKKYIKKHKLEKNVNFAGWLPTIKDVAKIYNQSKIFVMPSFNEGGPRVNLEAMACKVPVITARVGLMIDIIKNKENGLFVNWDVKDIAEKILLLLKDDNLRKKIAGNSHKTIQQFERKKTIKNYAETYKSLLYFT
jgi:glycosyltransferase involved in cell wall biosynthesis